MNSNTLIKSIKIFFFLLICVSFLSLNGNTYGQSSMIYIIIARFQHATEICQFLTILLFFSSYLKKKYITAKKFYKFFLPIFFAVNFGISFTYWTNYIFLYFILKRYKLWYNDVFHVFTDIIKHICPFLLTLIDFSKTGKVKSNIISFISIFCFGNIYFFWLIISNKITNFLPYYLPFVSFKTFLFLNFCSFFTCVFLYICNKKKLNKNFH